MAVNILQKPDEPVLARKRQRWTVQTISFTRLEQYRVEMVFEQEDDLPDVVISQIPNSVNVSYFEPSEIIDALLSHKLPIVRVDTDNDSYRLISAKIREVWFVSNEERENITDISFYALKAGVGHNLQQLDFNSYFSNKMLAFTGNGMKVTKESWQYVSFLWVAQSDAVFRVEGIVYYDDGSSRRYTAYYSELSPGNPFSNFILSARNALKVIDCSYASLGLANYDVSGKTIVQFGIEVRVGAFRTEPYLFTLVDKPVRQSFLFANSAGGWSVLHCFGNFEEESSFDYKNTEVNVPLNNLPGSIQFKNFDASERQAFTISTGFLKKGGKGMQHAKEFLKSRYRYVINESGDFVPIVLQNATYKTDQSQPGLLAIQFAYQYAFANQLYDSFDL
ncbi:MAG: hypothetical protein AAGI07_03810 [Bacteroidota bacterium]